MSKHCNYETDSLIEAVSKDPELLNDFVGRLFANNDGAEIKHKVKSTIGASSNYSNGKAFRVDLSHIFSLKSQIVEDVARELGLLCQWDARDNTWLFTNKEDNPT